MEPHDAVTSLIPHRPPFLWVDRILECDGDMIVTEKDIDQDLAVFQGHYPDHPIMPGVLLCESLFQSGALLIAKSLHNEVDVTAAGIPVLTRIGGARFKRSVHPGDTITMKVLLKEVVSSVYFFKGTLRVKGKVAVQAEFSCALVNNQSEG